MTQEKICGIYKITSPTNKMYIGQSIDIVSRFSNYKTLKCKSQPKIYNSLKKYGWENHKFEILETCAENRLNVLEIFYIRSWNSAEYYNLNLQLGGSNGRHSEETKKKISQAHKRKIKSEETRKKISEAKKGKPNLKLRGRIVSEEHRKNLSIAHKGHKPTTKALKNMSIGQINRVDGGSNKGKTFSTEWIENIRKSSSKRKHTPESKNKISENNRKRNVYLFKGVPVCQLSLDGFLLNVYDTVEEASLITGVGTTTIRENRLGNTQKGRGFIWK